MWNYFFTYNTSDEGSFFLYLVKYRPMVGQYPMECSIVFIMNLISAPFQLYHPFPSPLLTSIVATRIELFVSQWSSVTLQVTASADKM